MGYRTRLRQLKLEESARRGREVTYQEIAEQTEIAYSTIQRYANSIVPRPDYSVVDRLATYFGVAIRDFIYQVEDTAEEGQIVAIAAR